VVRPIGAQLSTRAVAFLGVSLVCAQIGNTNTCDASTGEASKTTANISFFIGFARAKFDSTIERYRQKDVQNQYAGIAAQSSAETRRRPCNLANPVA
jgi:hypothetical protein